MLNIGDIAPEFCNQNQDEVEICLRDLKGKWIVLYFYPKDNTPGCTNEACDFTQREAEFDDLDAVILGVSPDSPKKHQNFIAKKDLTITLLSDEEKTLCEAYGVWQLKKFMGREYMGVVRSTFIINPEGKIAAIWSNVKVRQKKKKNGETLEIFHADIVKDEIKRLQAN
ncbi:MAG: thioredoxin-dependent thiol peroxidase [Campylobacterota bacterium]|nr:thioredoxin-dependent thiol peroxidase [Campylobacterota bacterium]